MCIEIPACEKVLTLGLLCRTGVPDAFATPPKSEWEEVNAELNNAEEELRNITLVRPLIPQEMTKLRKSQRAKVRRELKNSPNSAGYNKVG